MSTCSGRSQPMPWASSATAPTQIPRNLEENKMLKYQTNSPRKWKLTGALISLLAVYLALTAPRHSADKQKKTQSATPVKPGDQRMKAYFDISKLVWPNPPAIARIRFMDLFTGEKIDSKLFAKEKPKQKWMDRLAGQQTTDEIKVTSLPFQLIRTYGLGFDSKGKIYAADQAGAAIFVFDRENKAKVEWL